MLPITARNIERVRERLLKDVLADDESITIALIRARQWIDWRIYDESIVAVNVLVDGYPHS